MPLSANQTAVKATIRAELQKDVTGFGPVSQKPSLDAGFAPDAAVYNHALIATYTLAAAASQVVDLYSLVSTVDGAVTITKARGFLLVASAVTTTGGQLRIERDATDGWAGLFDDASDKLTLDVGAPTTDGCALLLWNGATRVVSNTSKRIKLSNPGTQSITVKIMAILGT